MCGIAGIIDPDGDYVASAVLRMGKAMAHRGPDASGESLDRFGRMYVGLGHRRLAIVDLSPLGRQPMSTEDDNFRLVFNGEIFNFLDLRAELESLGERFKSKSDSEVLLIGLRRFGIEYVKRLRGMYVFAFLDRLNHSLYLARDPAGIKPLYYYQSENRLIFSSELRGMLAASPEIGKVSRSAIANFLAYGSVAQPTTIFEEVRMLEPGCWREYQATNERFHLARESKWWTPPRVQIDESKGDPIAKTRELLESSVRDHLIADVPVGVFLSAGIDSTILASLSHGFSKEVRAFTVALDDAKDMDEMEIASESAARIGMEHVPVRISSSDAEKATEQWFASCDQPSIDGLNTFVISKAIRQHGITVALSGLGADELFGGYPSFQEIPRIARLSQRLNWMPKSLRSSFASCVTFRKPRQVSDKFRDMLSVGPDLAKLATMRRRLMSNRELKELGQDFSSLGLSDIGLPTSSMEWQPKPENSDGWIVSVAESRYYQGNMLLRDSDANSMAHSLELRVPFLDQRLLDWVHTLPDHVRFPKGMPRKHLLRESCKDLLSGVLLRRPKTGFTLPIGRWMTGPLRQMCESNIASLEDSGFLNRSAVKSQWIAFLCNPDERSWTRAFALVVLGGYLKQFGSLQ